MRDNRRHIERMEERNYNLTLENSVLTAKKEELQNQAKILNANIEKISNQLRGNQTISAIEKRKLANDLAIGKC